MVHQNARSFQNHMGRGICGTGVSSIPPPIQMYSPISISTSSMQGSPFHITKKRKPFQRPLTIKHKTAQDYSQPLHVETSVEYDLPSHIYPPKNSGPILMIHPEYVTPRKVSRRIRQQNSIADFLSPSSSNHGRPHSSAANHYSNDPYLRPVNSSSTSTSSNTNTHISSNSSIDNTNITRSSNKKNINHCACKNRGGSYCHLSRAQADNISCSMAANTPEYSSTVSSHKKQRSTVVEQQIMFTGHHQPTETIRQLPPPPSYATATGLYSNLYRGGAVVPNDLVPSGNVPCDIMSEFPQMISSAHIVRSRGSPVMSSDMMTPAQIVKSRGSPKVRGGVSRRHHQMPPEYLASQRRSTRPSASTVASTSVIDARTGTHQSTSSSSSNAVQQEPLYFTIEDPAETVISRLQRGRDVMSQHRDLTEVVRLSQQHQQNQAHTSMVGRRVESVEKRIRRTHNHVDPASHLLNGAPLTPAEMMDQDPYPRVTSGDVSSLQLSTYFPTICDAPARRQSVSRQKSSEKNNTSNGWNFFDLRSSEENTHSNTSQANTTSSSSKRATTSVATPTAKKMYPSHYTTWSSHLPELNNSENEVLYSDLILRNISSFLDESLNKGNSPDSNQALNLSSTEIPLMRPSPTASLIASQILGVPTPPMSNLATPSSHFGVSGSTNFINNIYQLSSMNTPIFNLAY